MVLRIPFFSASLALLFVAGLTLLGGAFYPGYSHTSQYISELGARGAPHEWLVRWVGFLPAGILQLLFVVTAFKVLPRSVLTTFGLLGIAIYAFGYVAAAVYPLDGGHRSQPSASQVIHNLVGVSGYLLAPLSLAVLAWRARRWPHAGNLPVAGLLAAIMAFLGLLFLSSEFRYVGVSQRVLELSVLVWTVMCGWYIQARLPRTT